MINKVKVMCF